MKNTVIIPLTPVWSQKYHINRQGGNFSLANGVRLNGVWCVFRENGDP